MFMNLFYRKFEQSEFHLINDRDMPHLHTHMLCQNPT